MTTNNGSNGNGGKKRQDTAKRLIDAIHEAKGLMTLAAKRTGIGYRTACRYVAEFPTVQQAVLDAKEAMIDLAENKLFAAIMDGNMTAMIFYLKTQAKHRGYIERQEITGADGDAIKVDVESALLSKLEKIADAQSD